MMKPMRDILGTPLLLRGRRGVQPTPAGAALLEHAHPVLFTMGHVRLLASASAIAESLLEDLASFMRAVTAEEGV